MHDALDLEGVCVAEEAAEGADGGGDDVLGGRALFAGDVRRDGAYAADGERLLGDVELGVAGFAVGGLAGFAAEPVDGDAVRLCVFHQGRGDERDEVGRAGRVDGVGADCACESAEADEAGAVAQLCVFGQGCVWGAWTLYGEGGKGAEVALEGVVDGGGGGVEEGGEGVEGACGACADFEVTRTGGRGLGGVEGGGDDVVRGLDKVVERRFALCQQVLCDGEGDHEAGLGLVGGDARGLCGARVCICLGLEEASDLCEFCGFVLGVVGEATELVGVGAVLGGRGSERLGWRIAVVDELLVVGFGDAHGGGLAAVDVVVRRWQPGAPITTSCVGRWDGGCGEARGGQR